MDLYQFHSGPDQVFDHDDLWTLLDKQNLGVLARVPLASGYLSGKYKPGAEFQQNDVRNNHDAGQRDEKLRLVEEIRRNELPEGVPMAKWALAWCLQHPAVTSVIPGCKTKPPNRLNRMRVRLTWSCRLKRLDSVLLSNVFL